MLMKKISEFGGGTKKKTIAPPLPLQVKWSVPYVVKKGFNSEGKKFH
jgi:hypothetical protein